MIRVTALNGTSFILNCDHIEKVEEIPETVITLGNGKKYLVRENSDELVEEVINFKLKCVADVIRRNNCEEE